MRYWGWRAVTVVVSAAVVVFVAVRFGLLRWLPQEDGPVRRAMEGLSWLAAVLVAAVPAILVIGRWLRRRDVALSTDELADRLAFAVRAQWTAAATDRRLLHPAPLPIRWRRCTGPVAGPPGAATSRALVGSFDPLPGLDRITPAQLREGTHRMLHRIYGGLPSGRLIIAGGPGTGKSSAAILLLLDALDFRDHASADVPVPVLFTLQGWNPDTTPVHDWLATKLTELRPLAHRDGRAQAARLLAEGRIAVFLDGLDEIPEQRRATALRALADQATFRLVLLSRTHELIAATQHHILTGAVAIELQPLTPTDAATYLRHSLPHPPPEPWRRLLDTLVPNADTPLAHALDNPLTVTLLRDTYQPPPSPDALDQLLDTSRFPTPRHITDHLLDHAVTTAYTPRPGQPPPRYTTDTARRTLTVVAQHLRDRDTRDLAWWHIHAWVPRKPRAFLVLASVGFPLGLVGAVVYRPVLGQPFGLAFGTAVGLFFGLLSWHTIGLAFESGAEPSRLGRFRWKQARWSNSFALGLKVGPMVGLAIGAVVGLLDGLVDGLFFGLVIGATSGLSVGLVYGFARGIDASTTEAVTQPHRLGDIVFWLMLGLGIGLVGLPMFGVMFGLADGLTIGLAHGLLIGLAFVLSFSEAWHVAVSQIYLAVRHRIPLRLARFLDDAHERYLLRAIGPVYQFRHATLQDRLASPPATGH